MGNRVYFTLKNETEARTYYMHWNGGLDTWCPVAKVIFEHDIRDIGLIIEFITQKLKIKIEFQTDFESRYWIEENGHYIIDLDRKTFEHLTEHRASPVDQRRRRMLYSMQDEFEAYLAKHIREEFREKSRIEYWNGIQNEGKEFFK